MQHHRVLQCPGDLRRGVGGEPSGEQCGQDLPVGVPVGLGTEVGAGGRLEGVNGVPGPGHPRQVVEMPGGQGDHHHTAPVGGGEVPAERAVDVVADGGPGGPVELRLGEVAQRAGGGQCDVVQREHDASAPAGPLPLADGGDHRQSRVEARGDVPGRQGVVDHLPGALSTALSAVLSTALPAVLSGDRGEPEGGVDGVVDPGAAVATSEQFEGDDIGSDRGQTLMAHPLPAGGVGHEDPRALPGRGDEVPERLPALVGTEVEGHRGLAPVETGPVDRGSARGERPAVHVRRAAHRVDADDLGAELGEREPAQGRGHEAGEFDHADAAERSRLAGFGHRWLPGVRR